MSAEEFSVERRAFIAISGLMFTAASLGAASLPLVLPSAQAQPVPLTDWTIDDMWTGYPRPAQAIADGRARYAAPPEATAGAAAPGSIEVLFA